jgi:hypothetical protein
MAPPAPRRDGEPRVIGKTRQRNARSRECPPGFESSASAGHKLEAVFEILAVCAAIAAAVKRHALKHSKEGNKEF